MERRIFTQIWGFLKAGLPRVTQELCGAFRVSPPGWALGLESWDEGLLPCRTSETNKQQTTQRTETQDTNTQSSDWTLRKKETRNDDTHLKDVLALSAESFVTVYHCQCEHSCPWKHYEVKEKGTRQMLCTSNKSHCSRKRCELKREGQNPLGQTFSSLAGGLQSFLTYPTCCYRVASGISL